MAEMRALIFELRPGALAEQGLVAAPRKQAAALSAREQVAITVESAMRKPMAFSPHKSLLLELLDEDRPRRAERPPRVRPAR